MPDASRSSTGAAVLKLPTDPLRLGLFVLMVLTISRAHEYLGLDALHPGLTLAGLAVVYAFLNPKAVTTRAMSTWPVIAMAILATSACLSIPFGLSMGASAKYFLDNYSKVLLFALLLVLSIRGARDLYLLVLGWVIACGFLVWMSNFVFHVSMSYGSYAERLNNMYGYDANDAGLILTVGAPLCVLVFRTSRWPGRVVSGVILLGIAWTLALTGSRGAFLAMGAVALALLFLLEGVSIPSRLAVLAALVAALALAAPPGYWEQMGTILTPTKDYNWSADAGRVALARRGLGYMMDHPAFGIGIANFQRAEGTISSIARNAMPGVGVPWLAPHNSYVQAGAEMGLPGGLSFLALVFGGLAGMIRLRRRLPSEWARGDPEAQFLYRAPLYLGIAYLGFAIAAFFLSFAYLDPIYVLTAFSAGAYAATQKRMRATRPDVIRGRDRRTHGMRGALSLVERGA